MAIALTASYGDVWDNASPKTTSVTVANGDCLAVVGLYGGSAGDSIATPTGGGLTYTSQIAKNTATRGCYMWTAFPVAGQTYTITLSSTAFTWGFIVLRYTGVGSVGAKNSFSTDSGTTPDQVSLTTTTDHSAVVMAIAASGGAVTATYVTSGAGTFTQVSVPQSSLSNFVGYYADSGTHAAKTIGTTTSDAFFVVAGMELVLGITAPLAKSLIVNKALRRSTNY
jgi:hypothetical protein